MRGLLLPESDGAVALQLVVTLIVGPLIVTGLVRYGKQDVAWLAGGVLTLWLAFAAFRSLH